MPQLFEDAKDNNDDSNDRVMVRIIKGQLDLSNQKKQQLELFLEFHKEGKGNVCCVSDDASRRCAEVMQTKEKGV